MSVELPPRGFIFWPVGCGDSTTIKVNDNVVMQVDIHHLVAADDDDTPVHPVVDSLVEMLPTMEGDDKPYLAVFALTHADQDHCKGFAELLQRVSIGELWFSPRVIRDYEDNAKLCDDAAAFCTEATRRLALNQGVEADSGDRIRIIGSDDILDEDDYKAIPSSRKSKPGDNVTVLDGVDLDGTFRAFLHSPFGDDSTRERNKTSLGMQITLSEGDYFGRVMLLGDLDYPPLRRIFIDHEDAENTAWDVLLAPHHCSKSAMYYQDDGDDEPVLKQELLDAMARTAGKTGWVLASSTKVPASDTAGANPPHALAKARYEEIAPSGFLCTGDNDSDDPIVFEVNADGISLVSAVAEKGTSKAAAAIDASRGGSQPHSTTVGFGRR